MAQTSARSDFPFSVSSAWLITMVIDPLFASYENGIAVPGVISAIPIDFGSSDWGFGIFADTTIGCSGSST